MTATQPVRTSTPTGRPIGLRSLYQNADMNWQKASNPSTRQKAYMLVTEPAVYASAAANCLALNEKLANATSAAVDNGLVRQLYFLQYEGSIAPNATFWVEGRRLAWNGTGLTTLGVTNTTALLPAICTQSAPWNDVSFKDNSAAWQVEAQSGGLTFRGYRDALSFRFEGIPFSNAPGRFVHAQVNPQISGLVTALNPGPDCFQNSGGSENCLTLQIQTTYLPKTPSAAPRVLRPVMLWIYGGGFQSGSSSDPLFDGGQMASRSDVVTVAVNYRLGALGFLALRGATGNWAMGDVVASLKWLQKHIAAFGGDPNRVTIYGQSAGAQMVVALLQSPQAAGLFHRAIVQSGKAVDRTTARATLEEVRNTWLGISGNLGCSRTSDSDALACLRSKPASSLLNTGGPTRPIQDNSFLFTRQMDVSAAGTAGGAYLNRVPVMLGYMRDELGTLGTVPPAGWSLVDSLRQARVSEANIAIVQNNPKLFPLPNQPNPAQNLSVTVADDANTPSRRCGNQANLYAWAANKVFPAVYGYVFDTRSHAIPGYDGGGFCVPQNAAQLQSGNYGMCHSADLYPVFNVSGQTASRLSFVLTRCACYASAGVQPSARAVPRLARPRMVSDDRRSVDRICSLVRPEPQAGLPPRTSIHRPQRRALDADPGERHTTLPLARPGAVHAGSEPARRTVRRIRPAAQLHCKAGHYHLHWYWLSSPRNRIARLASYNPRSTA